MAPLQPQPGHFSLILPLCSSSATVGLALFQYPVFASFLATRPSFDGAALSAWWAAYLPGGVACVTAACATSAIGGAFAARWLRSHAQLETSHVAHWYTWGAVLAASHMLFFPLVGAPIKRMIESGQVTVEHEESGGGGGLLKNTIVAQTEDVSGAIEEANRKEMKTWFFWHSVRTVLVDIPALWCFAEGVALSFWIV